MRAARTLSNARLILQAFLFLPTSGMSGVWSTAPIDTRCLAEGRRECMTSNPTEGTTHIIFILQQETWKASGRLANSGILDSSSEWGKIWNFKLIYLPGEVLASISLSPAVVCSSLWHWALRADKNVQQQLNWLWHATLETFGAISPEVASFLGNNFTLPSERLQCLLANGNTCLPFTVFHYI